MNDLTSELREPVNIDAHSASPLGPPLVPSSVPNAFDPPLSGSGIELRVIRDGTPARRLRINATRCTFGSGEGCTVRLSDSSLQALHAVIVREADRVLIRSYSAAIEVNDRPTSESFLDCGDVFRLGSYLFETLSLPHPPADSAQDQAQRLRFMTAPHPELEAARQREQDTQQRLADTLQRCEQAESRLEAANRTVAELQQQIDSLSQQVESLIDETQTQQADADAQAVELRRLIAANEQAEIRSRAAVDEALQQRDLAWRERDDAVRQRDDAVRQRDAAQQQIQSAQQQLDVAQQQRSQALHQRDEALQQRDKAIERRSDAIDSEQAAQAKLRQLNQQILQLQQAQAAAESENLNELSLEAYMSRLLQQMERSPAVPPGPTRHNLHPNPAEPRPPLTEHQPPQPTAADAFYDLSADAGDAAAGQSPISERTHPPAEQHPMRSAATGAALPPPALPRPSAWRNLLQVAAVLSCSLIFFYCGQRNPNLQVVWYTASALAGGLVVFSIYDLLAKWLRRAGGVSLPGRPGQLTDQAVRRERRGTVSR
jgi:murein DD-endopeptidase MepM/ murein hydrolase activator NlpD